MSSKTKTRSALRAATDPGERVIEVARPHGPMRLQLIGDLLGTSLARSVRPASGVDVVVCAGDVTRAPRSTFEALRDVFPASTRIVCVLGDEEHHGQFHEDVLRSARQLAPSFGIDLLQDSVSIIGGVRFIGGTLWTDFRLHGEDGDSVSSAIDAADAGLLDAAGMRWCDGLKFSGYASLWPHWCSRKWMEQEFTGPFEGPTVVVTHHAPSARSLSAGHETDPLAPAYASPADDVVEQSGAALWIHGHACVPADHLIGRTRVVSNPCGSGDPCRAVDPSLVVQVPRPRRA